MSHIRFDEGSPNPYGWMSVLVIHEGATDPKVMRDTITERYKGDQIRWRHEPEAHEEKLFESLESRFWCVARLSVKKSEKVAQ